MIVRFEGVRKTSRFLVIDELDKYLGEIDELSFSDVLLDKDPFEEEGYLWHYANKQLLFLKIQENENS